MDALLDPRTFGLLNIGLSMLRNSGPSKTPQSVGGLLGGAGQDGMQAFMQANQAQQQSKLFDLKMSEAQREAAERLKQQTAIGQLSAQFPHLGPLFQIDPKTAAGRAFPEVKAPEPFTLAPGQQRFGPDGKPLAMLPKEPEPFTLAPGAKRYGPDGKVIAEAPQTPDEFSRALAAAGMNPNSPEAVALFKSRLNKLATHQPAAKVNVNTDNLGLKPKDRFDMEGKLRDDYRANPTVKAADEMDSAFKMIEAAYKTPSPANDLAMATKYMKILDPTSVVRESEFALAVGATGLFDKVQNYANAIIKGEKLNPTQRKDFYDSAKAITDSFSAERAKIGQQFEQNASQYNLTPKNVIGGPPVAPAAPTAPKPMSAMPPAAKHKGRTIEDSAGKRYRSDGMSWRPL
jgi:hypothetical protein